MTGGDIMKGGPPCQIFIINNGHSQTVTAADPLTLATLRAQADTIARLSEQLERMAARVCELSARLQEIKERV